MFDYISALQIQMLFAAVCRPDCGSPGACVAPNMCRCAGGVEAPSCGPGGGSLYPYPGNYTYSFWCCFCILIFLRESCYLYNRKNRFAHLPLEMRPKYV